MRFRIFVNRWANFFFFVNNLSGWHFSTIKPYNEYWIAQLGSPSEKERRALKQFAILQRRWPRKQRELNDFFFQERSPLAVIRQTLPARKHQVIQQAFAAFQEKFDRLYAVELSSLQTWQRRLRIALNTPGRNRRIGQALTTLYGPACAACSRTVPLYLLISAPDGIGGSADIDGLRITAEVSQSPKKKLPHILGTIWHEVIHLCFDKQHFRPILKRLYPKDETMVRRINEVTVASLFPAGILGERFFKIPLQLPTRSLASPEYAEKILELTESYLHHTRRFDRKFVQRVRKLLDRMK